MPYKPSTFEINYNGQDIEVTTMIDKESPGRELFQVDWPDGSKDMMYRTLSAGGHIVWFAKDPVAHDKDLKEIGDLIAAKHGPKI